MKKITVMTALAMGAMGAMNLTAQEAIQTQGAFDNVSIGLDGGVTTPFKNYPFFKSMRGVAGLHIQKQVTPVLALGVESAFGVNTSRFDGPHSSTVFDDSYVGAYGAVNLFNLFGGYTCEVRPFDIEVAAGAGWGHSYETEIDDINYFATKAGLNFNFRPSDRLTISVKPSVLWNMSGYGASQSSAAYNANHATFNLLAGVSYRLGDGFQCVTPYNQAEVDALNAEVNDLRAAVAAQTAVNAGLQATNEGLAADLAACMAAPKTTVIQEVGTNNTSVRYVFFKIGSYAITADQQPNVEMIAAYMKNHPQSKVVVKGYASPDGPEEVNIRLANQRAQAVKDALVKRYKIAADRIKAEGEGIGNMFKEESWNRVSICTIEDAD